MSLTQVQIAFDTKEGGRILRAARHSYQVFETKPPVHVPHLYSDNFAYPRRENWTH